jgi:ubiquinone/menaquinone biosynthesis C-methylase UbiE
LLADNVMKSDTFSPSSFITLKKAEAEHFWFDIRKQWIFDRISKIISPPAAILEIGCGTGIVSSFLAEKGYGVIGCEYYQEAVNMAWPGFRIVRGDANCMPFGNNSFDIVGLFDVIEHFEDDQGPLKEAARAVKPGGIVAVTVPARQELWSYIDEQSFHKRRYNKASIQQALLAVPLQPVSIEYIFMSLYFPMQYMRRRKRHTQNQFRINTNLNALLRKIFNVERVMSKFLSFPIGTSLLAVARKEK